MFDDIELTDCPEKYALNCKRYMTECHNCKANSTGKYLKYSPINKSIDNHPINNKQKSRAPSYSRKGRVSEKKFISNYKYLTATYASGTIGGDGDAKLKLLDGSNVRVEIKTRYKEKGSIFPTSKEFKESKDQKVKVIYILNSSTGRDRVYVDFKFFIQIFQSIIGCFDIHTDSKYTSEGIYIRFWKFRGYATSDTSQFTAFTLRGQKTSSKELNYEYTNNIDVYVNNHGHYASMEAQCFDELIDLYNYVMSFI